MGFIGSLQESLRTDFSERVLLLHYLSGWPSAHGSYALCEVDLSAEGHPIGIIGIEKEVQIVIEAIPGIFTGANVTGLEDIVRLDDPVEETQKSCPESNCSRPYPDLESLEGEAGPFPGDNLQQLDKGTGGIAEAVINSACLKSSSRSNSLQAGAGKITTEEDIHLLLTELAVLAPGVEVCSASYDALVPVVRGLQGRGVNGTKEQTRLKPKDLYNRFSEQEGEQRVLKSGDNQEACNGNNGLHAGRTRHPNLAPVLGLFQGETYLYVVYPAMTFTLQSLLYFSPGALVDDQHVRFFIFQILAAVAYSHKQGLIHGNLRPSNILLTDNLWCLITGFLQAPERRIRDSLTDDHVSSQVGRNVVLTSASDLHPVPSIAGVYSDWRDVMKGWWAGKVSNYDYLLLLNKLAGRRWADPCFHTVMPWVIDFSVKPDQISKTGWRDLTKSKWRLAKGDEQLDFTYASAEMPHHVSDECLSELAVCIYKARRLPLLVLRRIVRSVYEPNEYPVNMQRLYQWTPDECIPEFYADAHIFESIHPGMNNLAVPTWAKDAKDFTSLHRAALESDTVSTQLHHWIDLTFGYKLSGEAAVSAKNVTLSTVGPTVPRSSGRRQLFSKPHPQRQHCKTTDVLEKPPKATLQNRASQTSIDPYKVTGELCTEDNLRTLSLHSLAGLMSNTQGYDPAHAEPFSCLELLEEVILFTDAARHLSPCYKVPLDFKVHGDTSERQSQERNRESLAVLKVSPQTTFETKKWRSSPYNLEIFISLLDESGQYRHLVESLHEEVEGGDDLYESLWCMKTNVGLHEQLSVGESEDIFGIGCMIAELYLRRPLFDPNTATLYKAEGTVPDLVDCLPPYVQYLVKSTLQKDLARRPTASELLDSPFFSSTIRVVYFFLAPLQLLSNRHDQLQYVARMARDGAFVSMGHAAAEMCTPSALSLVVPPYEDIDAFAVITLITKLLQALKPHTSKRLIVPAVQRLLQSQQSPLLKVALLQLSFIKELWKVVGTGAYLHSIHSSVLGSLRRAPSRSHATAASKVLVSMCLNLGVPITLNQTVVPLLQAFGRDVTVDHIDVLAGIGERMGEQLVVKHLLPPLRSIIESHVDLLVTEGPGPVHSWRLLAMVDVMAVLDRLRSILRPGLLLRELLQEPHNVYMKVLLQLKLSPNLLQCAARALLLVCNHVGAEATVSYVLPQLKQFFDGLAFAGKLEGDLENGKASFKSSTISSTRNSLSLGNQENLQSYVSQDKPQLFLTSGIRSGGSNVVTVTEKTKVEDDILLVHIMYPGLASLVGIERLRQGLTTWLLLEQALLKHCNWKWEGSDANQSKNSEPNLSTEIGYESVNPASLLLDGVGWSTPLSQSSKWAKSSSSRRIAEVSHEKLRSVSEYDIGENEGPWSWVASKGTLWDAEAFGRTGAFGLAKDDHTWGLNSTILHSWRAHSGLIRSTILSEDENTVFTAGGGPRGGSIIREWRLATQECVMEYSGHEEAVNDVCILPGRGRLASCDGTIHIWNAYTGRRLAIFDESSSTPSSASSSSSSPSSAGVSILTANPGESGKLPTDAHNGNLGAISNHSLTVSLTGGGLYSCIHSMEAEERLLGGMVNGSMRFIDLEQGRQVYVWRFGQMEPSLSSFVSAIASSGQGESTEGRKYSSRSSWVAVGFGSGRCQLVDYNSGAVVGQWRAHDGFITKLYALEERYLVSSSVDKTISLWDLRRGTSPERLQVFRGHKHGVTSFSLKGCDLLSAAGSKIGLSRLSKSTLQGEEKLLIQPQKLYSAERGSRSLSNISTIGVLPFSRLFIIGTEDGHLKICS